MVLAVALGDVSVPVEQYWSPFRECRGRTKMGSLAESKKVRLSIVASPLLPDWDQVQILLEEYMMWAGDRMVSVAFLLIRNGW